MKNLLIIGSGDLAQLMAYHALNDCNYNVVGFLDDFKSNGVLEMGLPVIGDIEDTEKLYNAGMFDELIIGIGYKHLIFRNLLFNQLVNIIPFANIIHSSAYIDKSVKVGKGTFILPGCTLDSGVKIGDNVVLNTGVTIAHDSKIKSHVFIGPAVQIAGKVVIKERCFIGIGSTIIDNITINKYIQLGGGAVVIDNLTEKGLYVGLPAKLKKLNVNDF